MKICQNLFTDYWNNIQKQKIEALAVSWHNTEASNHTQTNITDFVPTVSIQKMETVSHNGE